MDIFEKEYEYTTVWQFKPLTAVILWSSLGVSHILWAYVYWHYHYNSLIDLISFVLNVLIWSQNIVIFILTLRNMESAESRGLYWKSTLYTTVGPWIIWPLTLLANFVHSALNIGKYHDVENATTGVTTSELIYTTDSYIVVKLFLFFLYNLIMVFVSFECFFPIYEWW